MGQTFGDQDLPNFPTANRQHGNYEINDLAI